MNQFSRVFISLGLATVTFACGFGCRPEAPSAMTSGQKKTASPNRPGKSWQDVPVRTDYPAELTAQLKAIGCQGYKYSGESRVFAGKSMTDERLGQLATLVADLPNIQDRSGLARLFGYCKVYRRWNEKT